MTRTHPRPRALRVRPMVRWFVAAPLAVICGAAVGAVDLQSVEVQGPALLIVLFTFVLGFVHGRGAFLWALIVGGSVPVAHVLGPALGHPPVYSVMPNRWATLVALVPALVGGFSGAFVGWPVRRLVRRLRSRPPETS